MSAIRTGVVEYLNAVPLWQALRTDARFRLVAGVPSQLAALMHAGQLDLGLLPVIEYFRMDETILVPGVAVCSDGPVESVRLFHKRPIAAIRTVRLDASSRTSAALAQVILHDFHKLRPVYSTGPTTPEQLETMQEDAALMIGDPCLRAAATSKVESLDLGAEWRRCTSLPFVYAAWVAWRGAAGQAAWLLGEGGKALAGLLGEAAKQGQTQIHQIAAAAAASKGLNASDLEIYLRTKIRYRLTALEVEGMRVFAARAAALGQCKKREIEFVGDALA